MRTLAIIGTAGRGEDLSKLDSRKYDLMLGVCRKVIALEGITDMVSGGAAWADHCAVTLHLEDGIPLKLWLPAYRRDCEIAGYYHDRFSLKLGRGTLHEVLNLPFHSYKGFKDRNGKVAAEADLFVAMTFGDKKVVKDGGTKDTVDKMFKRGITGYHMDLNSERTFRIKPI